MKVALVVSDVQDEAKKELKELGFSWKVGIKKWVWTGDTLVIGEVIPKVQDFKPQLYLATSHKFEDTITAGKVRYARWDQFPKGSVGYQFGVSCMPKGSDKKE